MDIRYNFSKPDSTNNKLCRRTYHERWNTSATKDPVKMSIKHNRDKVESVPAAKAPDSTSYIYSVYFIEPQLL